MATHSTMPGVSHGRRSLVGYSPRGLNDFTFTQPAALCSDEHLDPCSQCVNFLRLFLVSAGEHPIPTTVADVTLDSQLCRIRVLALPPFPLLFSSLPEPIFEGPLGPLHSTHCTV